MKSRPDPTVVTKPTTDADLRHPKVKAFAKRRLGPAIQFLNPRQLKKAVGEDTLLFATQRAEREENERRRKNGESTILLDEPLRQAALKTLPVLAQPEVTDALAEDLVHTLVQSAVQRLWAKVWPFSMNKRGERACWPATKATLMILAMGRSTSHVVDAYRALHHTPHLQQHFADLDWTAAERAEAEGIVCPDWRPFVVCDEKTVLRQLNRLGAACRRPALEAGIEMIKELQKLYPDAHIGKHLSIDGTAVPAWCSQLPSYGDPELEAELRGKCPEAGYLAIGRKGRAWEKLVDGPSLPRAGLDGPSSKSWRGYYLVTILDQATGLPLISGLFNAKQNEADHILVLLDELYELWPEIEPEYLVADAGWDNDWACQMLEVEYGIKPVFPKHNPAKTKWIGRARKGVAGFDADGRLVCAHGTRLDYLTAARPSRGELEPGEPGEGRYGEFRVRGSGCEACGTPGIQMQHDWSSLTTVPHHPHGRPDLYAMRVMLSARHRNLMEGYHNRLKSGYHLGLPGADRTRITDRATHEALFLLANVSMISLALADQLQRRGRSPQALKPAPARVLLGGRTPAPAPAPASASASQPSSGPKVDPFAKLFGPRRGVDRSDRAS